MSKLRESPSKPSQLAERTDSFIASISHALSELVERDCVELLVDKNLRKNRVYGLTETGQAVWEDAKEQQLL